MTTNLWCDRTKYKRDIQKWLEVNEKFSAICISDSQELRDIINWIKNNTQDYYSIGIVHYDSDVEILKHIFLESLTINLGEHETFQNFYKSLNDIETNSDNFSIKQEVGNQASAKGSISIKDVNPTVNIYGYPNEPTPPEVSKEKQINRLFSEFIDDIKNLNKDRSFLFIIKFGKKGFSDLSADFKNWFLQFFCQKMILLKNVKICILNQGNIDDFKDFSLDYDENIPEYLEFNDVVDETNFHFCCGAIDSEDNRIQYNEFKRKLEFYKERLDASAG